MAADQTFSREKAQGALAGMQDSSCEQWHVSFRAFSGSGRSDPVEDLRRLYELCYLWLRPDLHTKEQMLDMLVMEQFMISMPQELQVLVKESAVQSCKDLQDVLRSSQRPKKWTIVSIEGQEFLMRSSDVQMANAEAGDRDLVTDLSKKPQSSGCEIHPENIQGVVAEAPMKTLQEGTHIKNVDAEKPSTQVFERQVSTQNGKRRDSRKTQRSSKRRKQENTSISQDVATHLDTEEFSGQPVSSVHPVGKKATGGTSNVCSLCKKEFRYKSQFSIHWRTHTGERPFKCNTCSGSFMQTSDLRVHQRIHTGEKPYCCEICLKTFTHDSTLRSHKRIHTKEKPYVCEECGKAFSHKGNLNVHQRTHSGVKPYTCHECNCAFRQLGTFKRHQKIH
ncbi:LOW QUALITY PROTEIN: zinc finger and SCAN domain-containing protein 5A-like [Prionailurus bengalensis]|uniref:LOW QUALITY PROTEIN: zinc finger and SCAN domain-containing protein 5A-like n=1 Tax=Prionailurus bengalensis TaxID=37029 RepID=UPI001CA99E70|nr:LOW QUALITY PROTEIN: zinc finger and SCAN domain-containing protein 5A-like [Prionailurus bengalensis]